MKKALVLGGSGFIGSHLTDLLLSKDYQVTALDNFVTGSKDNVSHIKTDNFSLIEHDIQSELPLSEKFDEIYNLASPASPDDFPRIPVEILMTAAKGQQNVLEYAKTHGGKVLFASTSEVYGDPEVHPQPESYLGNVNCTGPRGVYDEAKRFAEALTLAYHRKYGVDTRLVRIFNTYGPRMRVDDGRIIPNFFSQGLRNQPLTVYGDGFQSRSFCYVSDMAEGLFAVMQTEEVMPFNVGSQFEHNVLEMAKIIKELTGNTKEIVFKDLPIDDPKQRRPDSTRIESLTGWKPKVSLKDGLQETLNYYKGTSYLMRVTQRH